MICRLFRIRFAERIIRAPEYYPCSVPLIQVHWFSADMTVRLVSDLFSACLRCELPTADEADKSLLTAFNLSVFVQGRGSAIRAQQFGLNDLWYGCLHDVY
jgi:hypothetical protein